ncbi:MAG: hypothetical protein JSV24_02010, partial [Bacteroidales bacterium]
MSDILNGLTSGGLQEAFARFAFIKGVSDTVLSQNVFPSTMARETLKLTEFLDRAGKDPLGMLLLALGPGGAGALKEADCWLEVFINENPDINSSLKAIIKGFLEADRHANIFNLINLILNGKAVGHSISPVENVRKVGHPIVLHRGEFEHQTSDLKINGAGINFEIQRIYRSRTVFFGPFGPSWDHNYNIRLHQENEYIIVCLTGQQSEHIYVRNPYFGSSDYNYYVPPNGVHDILVHEDSSFVLKKPQGMIYRFESTDQPGEHRINRVEDQYGNYLKFVYSLNDLLEQVYINSESRFAIFQYDEVERLTGIADHTGRTVRYTYDDWGNLSGIIGPFAVGDKPVPTERYEYHQVGESFKLVRISDWEGRIFIENEYEVNPISEFYGYVIRHCVNKGESHFVYESIRGDTNTNDPYHEIPVLRVFEYKRNGQKVEHVLNEYGNELLKREKYIDGCSIREPVTKYHYNADGEISTRIDPNGVVMQFLYGRDHLADTKNWPDLEISLGDISIQERMSFGNLLAKVTRGKRITESVNSYDSEFWKFHVPLPKSEESPLDHIIKYQYDEETQLLRNQSDPRYTLSADPLHNESSKPGDPYYDPSDSRFIKHKRHLTLFEYGSHKELKKIMLPDRSRPSCIVGESILTNIHEEISYFISDGKLRPFKRIDVNGYEWINEYFTLDDGPKEGFISRQLIPHLDWELNKSTPDILEIKKIGIWQVSDKSFLSGGDINDKLKISVEGVQIALFQSVNRKEIASDNSEVEIRVDGNALPELWDQTIHHEYIITNLSPGIHEIEMHDRTGIPMSIGRIRSHTSIDYEVDELGNIIRETDALGNKTEYKYNSLGQRIEINNILSTTFTGYDPKGRIITECQEWRDENGNLRPEAIVEKQYTYDRIGKLLTETEGTSMDESKRLKVHRYDPEDNLCETRNPRGVRSYFHYDALNRHIRTTRAGCSPDCSVTKTYFDLADNILFTINPKGGYKYNGYKIGNNFKSSVDTLGRPFVTMDSAGNLKVTSYDKLNNSKVIRKYQCRSDGQYELLSRIEMDYDEQGDVRVVSEAVFITPILTQNPFDPEKTDDNYRIEDNEGKIRTAITEYHLDAGGNKIAIVNPDGGIHKQKYDSQGRVFDETDPEGNRIYRIYDGNSNPVC